MAISFTLEQLVLMPLLLSLKKFIQIFKNIFWNFLLDPDETVSWPFNGHLTFCQYYLLA